MYYRAKQYPKKIKKRIMRHKRTRYHNDAAFFMDEQTGEPRKRRKAMFKREFHEQLTKDRDAKNEK